MKYCPRIDLTKVGHFYRIKILKFDNSEIFYVWDRNFDFLRKTDQFWANILYVQEFFLAKPLQKNLFLCS